MNSRDYIRIKKEWGNIINSSLIKPKCRELHINSLPFRYEDDKLFILINDKNINYYRKDNLTQIKSAIKDITNIDVDCDYIYYSNKLNVKSEYIIKSIKFVLDTLVPRKTAMTTKDFQNEELENRSIYDYIIDVVEGKLAEYIFNEFFHNLTGYTFDIDNDIYEDTTVTDSGNDMLILHNNNSSLVSNIKVDIKSSKKTAQWLLVEKTKSYADVYIMVKINFVNERFLKSIRINKNKLENTQYRENIEKQLISKLKGDYTGIVCGYAYINDIIDPITKNAWFLFRQEEHLLKVNEAQIIATESPLHNRQILDEYSDVLETYNVGSAGFKAKHNYGIPITWLRNGAQEWVKLFSGIFKNCNFLNDQIYLNQLKLLKSNSSSKYKNVIQELEKRRNNSK